MSDLAIRCDACGAYSRVPMQAIGRMAICPECLSEFVVAAGTPQSEIPTVHPLHRHSEPADGLLFGLALSAFLVPLAWLLAKALGARPPVFTLGLPFAIAFAATGLGVGVALAKDWSFRTRMKGILALVVLAWGLAAMFYFLKSEWVEAFRRDLGLPPGNWQKFDGQGFSIQMPGKPKKETVEVVRGWTLDTWRFADRKDGSYAFCVGAGRPAVAKTTAEKFFDEAKEGALAATNGTLVAEKAVVLERNPGREYVFKLGDQATNRTVRVYLVGQRAVVAMAEGAFLPPDAREVRKFFNSLDFPVEPP